MDRQKLREQYKKTGNLMDVFHDHDALRDMVTVEDESGDIETGFPAYYDNLQSVYPEHMNQSQSIYKVQLLSIIYTELQMMMSQANLGAGTEAAIVEGRQRIHDKLAQLSEEQQSFFDALIAEELSAPLNRPVRGQLKAQISSLLSATDWEDIGKEATNALKAQWSKYIEAVKST
jgi:hypothetical protein